MAVRSPLSAGRTRSPIVRRRSSPARPQAGTAGLFAGAHAGAGASVSFALGAVAARALGLTPFAVLAAGLVVALIVRSDAEGASMFPEACGPATIARHALDDLASFVAGWAMLLAYAVTVALAALFAARYLSVFWAPLGRAPWDVGAAAVLVLPIAAVGFRGLVPPAKVHGFVVAANLSVQALLVLLGALLIFHPDEAVRGVDLGVTPTGRGLVLAIALGMASYAGFESIAEVAGETGRAGADAPRAMRLALATVVASATGIALVAMMAMPVSRGPAGREVTALGTSGGHGFAGAPLLGVASRLPLQVLSEGARVLVGVVTAGALVVAGGIAMAGAVRLASRMAQRCQLPQAASRTGRAGDAAVAAVALAAWALLAAALLHDSTALMAAVYVGAAMPAAIVSHVAIVTLRWREPYRYRPLAARGSIRVRGRAVPVTAVAGAAAATAAWVAVLLLAGPGGLVGAVWLAAGLAGYALYRRRLGIGLTEWRERAGIAAAGPRIEVAFRSILIPVTTDRRRVPPAVVDVAAGLCAERGARIVVLAFTRIPLSEEMDVELPETDARIERLASQARALGDAYGIRVDLAHLRTRDPAESILAETHRRRSDAVLLGATARPGPVHAGLSRDPVARRVAAEAGVRVMVVQPAPNRPLPAAWAEPPDERGPDPRVPARVPAAAAAPLVDGGWPRLVGRPRA